MLIYHGTRVENIPSILTKGLLPRYSQISNWNDLPSREDVVYLSDAYAPFYAHHCNIRSGALIEIDLNCLNQELLYPDEDFLEQFFQNIEAGDDINNRTAWFKNNLTSFQTFWNKSMESLGNCCYRGEIPLCAISRITTWCVSDLKILVGWSSPIFVSMEHYKAEGQLYRWLTKCFAKREVDLDALVLLFKKCNSEMTFDNEEYKNYLLKEISIIDIIYDK